MQSATIARHRWYRRNWSTLDCRGEVIALHNSLKAAVLGLRRDL